MLCQFWGADLSQKCQGWIFVPVQPWVTSNMNEISLLLSCVFSWGSVTLWKRDSSNQSLKTISWLSSQDHDLLSHYLGRDVTRNLHIFVESGGPFRQKNDGETGRRLAQLVACASHVPRLCSGPGFCSRPRSFCCVSLPSLTLFPVTIFELYCQ